MPRLGLLFDLDGTLIDSIDLLLQCMHHAFDGRTRAPTREQWVAGIGTPLRTQLAEWCDDDAMVESLVGRYREFQDLHLERLTSVYDGVHSLIGDFRARGHATAIVTSKGRGMTRRSLEHVGLDHAFDVVVTVEDTSSHKPHPAPVLYALEQLGIAPSHALFAGDSPHDMHAGRSAGVRTVACLWGPFGRGELERAGADYWAESPLEIREIVDAFVGGMDATAASAATHSNHSTVPVVQSGDFHWDHDRSTGDNPAT